MRRDLSGGSTSSTATSMSTVFEVDIAYSDPSTLDVKATPTAEPDIPSLIVRILRDVVNLGVAHWLTTASESTGGYVKFVPEFAHCPVLLGNDGQPVALFEFIEAIDGVIDYESLKEELPTLSFAQINGAILFLRKAAQFNTEGIDIDEVEDLEAANDPHLIEALKQAIADQETARVLDYSKRNL